MRVKLAVFFLLIPVLLFAQNLRYGGAGGIETPGATQGSILYYDGTKWWFLTPGTAGHVLHTNGAGANPTWDSDDGAGGGAPTDATYWVSSANGSLTNEQVMGTPHVNFIHLVTETFAQMRASLDLEAGTDFYSIAAADATFQPLDAFLTDIAALTDPNADRILFWDDNVGDIVWLGLGSQLEISGTTLQVATGGIGDSEIDYTNVTLNDLTFDVGSVSKTEYGYLNGVTSAIQTQLGTMLLKADFPDSLQASIQWRAAESTPASGDSIPVIVNGALKLADVGDLPTGSGMNAADFPDSLQASIQWRAAESTPASGDSIPVIVNGVLKYADIGDLPAGSETNNLEGDGAANIADTEIFIGTGAGTGNYAAIGGEAAMANDGTVTLDDDALDDQYYDSEADLTALLDDNYEGELDNSAGLRAALSDESGTGVFLTANGDGSGLSGVITSIEWEDAADLESDGSLSADVVAAEEMANVDHGDVAWDGGVAEVQAITVSDDESTNDNQEVIFTTDNSALESDGDFHYNPSTGTVTATIFSGALAVGNISGLGSNVATWLATPSSANLASAVTGETGSGALVFATSPTLGGTPVLPSTFTIGANSFIRSGAHNLTLTTSGATNVTLPTSGTIAVLTSAMTGTFDGNNFGGGAVGQGDLLYGSAAGTISELAKSTSATRYLSNQGSSNNPSWNQVNLANGVTGTLPLANGGTSFTTADTLMFTWGLIDTVIVEDISGKKVPQNGTIVEVGSYTNGGTVDWNVEIRAAATPNTAGTDVLASDQVADTDQQTTNSISSANITKGQWLVPDISAVGTPASVTQWSGYILWVRR
jgi:hypothetical protein